MTQQLATISEESIAAIKKAQTQGFTGSSGLVGVDLGDVISLVPANTPLFDRVARKTPDQGAPFATWRALLNINNQQPSPFVGIDAGGNFILNSEQDMNAPYRPVRVSGQVTKDAIALGRNYFDAKARAVASTMIQWRLQANKAMWGGQAFALPAIGAVTLTGVGGGTTIPTGTAVRVQARSGLNYFWGGSSLASANVTTGAAATSVTASWASVKGAVAYDVFVNTFYYTTVVANSVSITSVPVANAAVPLLPDLFATAPSLNTTTDTSFSLNSYNGLLASLAGDVSAQGNIVTPGTGAVTSGAFFQSLNGAAMTANGQGVAEIDNVLLAIWNQAQLSPDIMWVNAQEAQSVANKVLSVNTAVTYLNPDGSRAGITAGASVARYLNKAAGGAPVEIMVDPHLPPGRIVFATERVPYPESGIVNAMEVRTLVDVSQTDYGPSLVAGTVGGGPREVFDVSSFETFLHRAPVACGVLTDVAPS
jgi:hypothetical protein